jgi:hypothetical protein
MPVTTAQIYLSSTNDVVRAGRELLSVIDRPGPARQNAVDELVNRTHLQEAGANQFRAFMFSTLEGSAPPERKEQVTEEVLGNVALDMDVAGLLIAGGQAVGEVGGTRDRLAYERALARLDETRALLEQALREATQSAAAHGQPSDADQLFRHQAQATLTTLVDESRGVLRSVVDNLKEIDPAGVLNALGKVGDQIEQLPKVGRLVRLGLRKLEQAVQALQRLFGAQVLAGVREAAIRLWKRVVGAGAVDDLLEATIGVGDARAAVDAALAARTPSSAVLNQATSALADLEPGIRVTMGRLRRLVGALAAAVAVALVVGVVLAQLAAVVPAIAAIGYALAIAAMVVLARDFADSGRGLGRVRGVRSIIIEHLSS